MTLEERIETAKNSLAAATTDEQRDLFQLGIQKLQDLIEQQKKSEIQTSQSTGQLQKKPIRDAAEKVPQEIKDEVEAWAEKVEREANYAHIETSKKQPESKTYTTPNNGIKTVEAPDFIAPEELINVKLEDSKGNKQVRTFSKAQVRALARKYFSNVHESWLGKDRKMGVGFKNLLAYVVAWKEFDGALPVLRDVLPDYDRYNKGGESKEASEAFKVAQELYNKIVEILNDAK